MRNLPCGHETYVEDLCPTWGPVDGCQCQKHLGHVSHGEPKLCRDAEERQREPALREALENPEPLLKAAEEAISPHFKDVPVGSMRACFMSPRAIAGIVLRTVLAELTKEPA